MGLLRFLVKSLVQGTFVFLLVAFTPGLPPYVEFTEFKVSEPIPLQGTLTVNTLLNNAEHLYSGQLHGPEAFVDHQGTLYTGLHGGEIVKFVNGKIVPVTKFGKACGGFWEEKVCGRPLGLNFGPDGFLYVADAYNGLFRVDVKTGLKKQLVSFNDTIEGKVIKLPNSVVVASDGTVYWTCSSSNFYLEDGVLDGFADGSGRLLKYDPKTNTNEVLIEGLHFANGVALSPNEDFVIVAETFRSRIHRYYLKGPKKGTRDIFIDGLPGIPDNLKSDGEGGFFVPLVVVRDKYNPVLFQSIGQFPLLRKFLSRVLGLLDMAFQKIDELYPNYYAKRAAHYIGHFESVQGLIPKGFILLQLDENGNIKRSFHNTDNSLSGISEAHWFDGAFYFGSPYNTYLGRVKLSFAENEPTIKKEHVKNVDSKPKLQTQPQKTPPTQKPSPPPQAQKPPSPQQAQKPPPQQAQKPSPPSQQTQKPSPPPQQDQKPSPPPQQTQKPLPSQAQKPSSPPQQAQKPSLSPQQTQKPSPPPTQAQKPSPPQQAQKPSPPPQQAQKPSPPPQQVHKPSPPPQQAQKPSPPPQQAQKPSPPPQQAQKPSPPPQQAQKPSPPPQAQKPSPPPQAQKPSPPPQQTQKPSPPPQAQKPSLPQQPQKQSSPPQQTQKPSPSPKQNEIPTSEQKQQQKTDGKPQS